MEADLEFCYLWMKLDPNITSHQIVIFLASFHYLSQGHVAIDQEMVNDFLVTIGFDENIQLNNTIHNSILVGGPGDFKPFVYFEHLLYQHKSFTQEREIAEWLIKKSNSQIYIDEETSKNVDESYLVQENNLQKKAVFKSFQNAILFITGGPGTGKTYTVQQILAAHKDVFGDLYSIKIAAPTGKAAQRINDSFLGDGFSDFKATTIHQLLGINELEGGNKYNRSNLLPADLVIIDEASMMDLSLWSALSNSISSKCRLIIVGDPFQLASVESGSVLSDICTSSSSSNQEKLLENSIVELKQRHRYSKESGIHEFADSINNMDAEAAMEILENASYSDINWLEPTSANVSKVLSTYAVNHAMLNPNVLISEFRILTALRNGPFGCNYLNKSIERQIKKESNIPQSMLWFHNRIIMANKNDYRLGLRNGELGAYDSVADEVNFAKDKCVSVNQLQSYESGYCITIHKSQGSEYDHVAIVLPEYENALLTKELLYTAVTRARKSVLVVGNKKILTHCITNKTKRKSGLNKQLIYCQANSGSHS